MNREWLIRILAEAKKSQQPPKSPVRPSRRSKYIARRHIGRINFWDLASISTGPEITQIAEINYTYPQPSFGTQADYGDPTSGPTVYPAIAEHDYDGLLSKIFEQPVSNWRDYYKKVVPSMKYNIAVSKTDAFQTIEETVFLSDGDPLFTDNGLSLPSDYFTSGKYIYINQCSSLTPPFMLNEHSTNKITTELDISAPAVPFTPSHNMDVFLIPSFNFAGAWAQLTGPAASGAAFPDQHLNDYWIFFPRGYFFDPSHPIYGIPPGFNSSGSLRPPLGIFNFAAPYDPSLYANAMAVSEYLKTIAGSRGAYAATLDSSGGAFASTDDGNYFNTDMPGTPTDGDSTAIPPLAGIPWYYSVYFVPANQNLVYLRAVVKKGGTFYYFWNSGWA